jgi:hypothetical protein
MHVPMCGQGSGQDLLPKAYLEKGPRFGAPVRKVTLDIVYRDVTRMYVYVRMV